VTEPRADDHGTDDAEAAPTSALPFAIALGVVVVVGVLALVFLRSDDEGRLVRPERLSVVDDRTVRAVAPDQPACERIERAQVEADDDRLFVELVAVGVADCDREGERVDVEAVIDLPLDVGERAVVAGVGRTRLPCTGEGRDVTCTPTR